MTYDDPKTLVSTQWLGQHLHDPDLRVIDGSWHLPDSGRNPRAEYDSEHIPGARFFDLDEISDSESPYPHMVPQPEKFVSRMQEMGIGDGHQIVVYDTAGIFSAARVRWLFRHMGHADVAILDGGLPKWKAEGREIDDMLPTTARRHKTARRQSQMVCAIDEVVRAVEEGGVQVVDARPAARFRGEAPEPRPGLRKGHIPGSINIPFDSFTGSDGTLLDPSELAVLLEGAGVDMSKPVITSCGSGVTASIVSLALEILGHRNHVLYDGSWAEWGSRNDLPLELGR